jgi:hypothetical protein
MKTIIIILLTSIILQAQPDTIPSFSHLPKYKQEFYSNIYQMAVYTKHKWNVPVYHTMSISAQKTNYGRNGRFQHGDLFNTGKKYPVSNCWDEFGLMMKTTHNYIELTRQEAISVSKKTEEIGFKF